MGFGFPKEERAALHERFADRLATMGDGKLLSTAATEAHASTHLTTQATTGAGQ